MKADDLTYDLGNLCAYDIHSIDLDTYKKDTNYLISHTQESVQFMFNKLYDLTKTEEEDGLYVQLPVPDTILPREKPIPTPKPPTRWELLAKRKGIVKHDKDKLVYSEDHDEFRTRYGYKSKNEKPQDWVIEAKSHYDYSQIEDPFMEKSLMKKKQKEIASMNQIGNMSKQLQAEGRTLPSSMTDKLKRRNKKKILDSFDIAKMSTASMGNFDRKLKNEPKRSVVKRKEKQAFAPNEYTANEKADQSSILNRVLKTQEEKQKRLTTRAVGVFQQVSEKQTLKKKKMTLMAQNKSRWYSKAGKTGSNGKD